MPRTARNMLWGKTRTKLAEFFINPPPTPTIASRTRRPPPGARSKKPKKQQVYYVRGRRGRALAMQQPLGAETRPLLFSSRRPPLLKAMHAYGIPNIAHRASHTSSNHLQMSVYQCMNVDRINHAAVRPTSIQPPGPISLRKLQYGNMVDSFLPTYRIGASAITSSVQYTDELHASSLSRSCAPTTTGLHSRLFRFFIGANATL